MEEQAVAPPADGGQLKLVKPKKEKPVVRERHRRPKASEEITSKKLIQEDKAHYRISFPEDLEKNERFMAELLSIPGMSIHPTHGRIPYDPKHDIPVDQLTYLRVYQVRASDESLQAVYRFGKKNRFDFTSDIAIRAHSASEEGKRLEKLSYAKASSLLKMPKFKLGGTPLPFQKAGAYYALEAKRTFIADEMGLGKTVEAILTMACAGIKKPWLIMVPSSLRINWWKECRKWLPKRFKVAMIRNRDIRTRTVRNRKTGVKREVLLQASKDFLANNNVFIMTYDKVHRFSPFLEEKEFEGFVADESHYLKGRSTKRTIKVKEFVHKLDEKGLEYVLLLSGTPLMNKPMDLISQLQILGRLADFGGFNHFVSRYCSLSTVDTAHVSMVHKTGLKEVGEEAPQDVVSEMSQQSIDEALRDAMVRKVYENMVALNKGLRSQCFVRREKEDVLKELPAKSRQTIALEISNRKDYEAIEADVVGYLANLAASDEKFLESIKALKGDERKAAISKRRAWAMEKGLRAEALRRIEVLKQTAAFGKLKATKEWIQDFLESGKKLVVFTTHKKVMDELENMFPGISVSIRSGMSPEKKDAALEEFQKNKIIKIIFISLKMAVGLTCTAASDTLTVEFGWTPAVHDQAEDRVHRIGQKKAVMAYYHVAIRTIEEKIGTLIEKKRRIVNAVADGDPLKGADQGSVLGSLMQELTGSVTLY